MKDTIRARPDAVLGDRSATPPGDRAVGSPEHLHVSFERAVAAADRAIGVWLGRMSVRAPDDSRHGTGDDSATDLRGLRAVVRASATAYARRLRDDGITPERMVVLVKEAAGRPSSIGFAVQELTNDMVRWSIEAYFDV